MPLGSDIISNKIKTFNEIKMIYIGTFNNRDLGQTIKGYVKFYDQYKDKIKISYDIIGSGNKDEIKRINELVHSDFSNKNLKLHGYIKHNKLCEFLNDSNLGISYVPINEIYDIQPVTKTYEYLLSGIPVLATSTYENKLVINNSNGILINDNANDFYNGLVEFYNRINHFDSVEIMESSLKFNWEKIINNRLVKILNQL